MLESPEVDASFRCTQCSYQTVWWFQLDKHLQTNHGNVSRSLFHAGIEPEQHPCVSCSYKSNSKLQQYEHYMSEHHARITKVEQIDSSGELSAAFEEYSCKRCEYKGQSSLVLVQHSCETAATTDPIKNSPSVSKNEAKSSNPAKHLVNLQTKDKEIGWFYCEQCSYRVRKKSNLQTHVVARHTAADEIKWFHCTKCYYRAKTKSNLTRHMVAAHSSIKGDFDWLNCTDCSYRTTNEHHLKQHLQEHIKSQKSYNCTKCSYRATHKGHLESHMLIHGVLDNIKWYNRPL